MPVLPSRRTPHPHRALSPLLVSANRCAPQGAATGPRPTATPRPHPARRRLIHRCSHRSLCATVLDGGDRTGGGRRPAPTGCRSSVRPLPTPAGTPGRAAPTRSGSLFRARGRNPNGCPAVADGPSRRSSPGDTAISRTMDRCDVVACVACPWLPGLPISSLIGGVSSCSPVPVYRPSRVSRTSADRKVYGRNSTQRTSPSAATSIQRRCGFDHGQVVSVIGPVTFSRTRPTEPWPTCGSRAGWSAV